MKQKYTVSTGILVKHDSQQQSLLTTDKFVLSEKLTKQIRAFILLPCAHTTKLRKEPQAGYDVKVYRVPCEV